MRTELTKLIGQTKLFTAVIGDTHKYENSVVLLNLSNVSGKILSDHNWVSKTHALNDFKKGDKVVLRATVTEYTDRQGLRKTGITKCYDYALASDFNL